MDFDDSFFEETTNRKKKITLQPYDARYCEELWFMDCTHQLQELDGGAESGNTLATSGGSGGGKKDTVAPFEPACDKLKFCVDHLYQKKLYYSALYCAVIGIKCTPSQRGGLIRDMAETATHCLLHLGHASTAIPIAVSLLTGSPNDLSLWRLAADCFFCSGRIHDEMLCRQRCIWLNHITYNSWLSLYSAYRSLESVSSRRGCTCGGDGMASLENGVENVTLAGSTCPVPANKEGTQDSCSDSPASASKHAPCVHSGACSSSTAVGQCVACSCLTGLDRVDYTVVLQQWTAQFSTALDAYKEVEAVCKANAPYALADTLKPSDLAAEERRSLNAGSADRTGVAVSRMAAFDWQPVSKETQSQSADRMQLMLGCLAHARCHLELSCHLSSSMAKQHSQSVLDKMLALTDDCQAAAESYAACRKAFSLAQANKTDADDSANTEDAADDNDVYGRILTPQRNTLLSFHSTWFPWLK